MILSTRALLLQLLRLGGPGHGLELIQRSADLTSGKVCPLQGSVYPELRAMEHAGLIRCQEESGGARGGRPKRVFSLTRAGRIAALKERFLLQRISAKVQP
jgi:DNA-binding PadR family transcriptional regulator